MNKNPDFIMIPHQIILDKNLQPLDRVLYGVIYWLVKLKNERCSASNETLRELSGSDSSASIKNSLGRLEQSGYIKRMYFDDKKKKRDEIIPLVVFDKVALNNDTIASGDYTGVASVSAQKKKSTNKNKSKEEVAVSPFNKTILTILGLEAKTNSDSFLEGLKKKYPYRDYLYQANKCRSWWDGKGKEIKMITAYANWLENTKPDPTLSEKSAQNRQARETNEYLEKVGNIKPSPEGIRKLAEIKESFLNKSKM